jgi:LDH2 family malate/lactate/ureidoglycolate dehydrogenase
MKVYTREQLFPVVQQRFERCGLSVQNAQELTEQLFYSEQRGIESHGLVRIKWIVEQLHKYPRDHVQLLAQKSGCELYDAHGVLGYLALNQVVESQRTADEETIKFIGIRDTYPTGALSYFAEKLASKGWIVLMSSTSPRRVGLYGDNSPLVGTNPWTFALPIQTQYGGHVVVDVSLAEVTHGQCLKLVSTGLSMPSFAASQPGGMEIKHPDDLWKDGKWNAIIHPIGRDKAYKSFGVMWSLHVMGSRILGIDDDNMYGTFILLLSPKMWEPIISREKILEGLEEEIEILRRSKVAHVPGEGRMKKFNERQNRIVLEDEIIKMLEQDCMEGIGN